MLSSRWRGTTVTISISARKATSAWVRPGGSGSAMVCDDASGCEQTECHLFMFLWAVLEPVPVLSQAWHIRPRVLAELGSGNWTFGAWRGPASIDSRWRRDAAGKCGAAAAPAAGRFLQGLCLAFC